jgi:hypothetical protein
MKTHWIWTQFCFRHPGKKSEKKIPRIHSVVKICRFDLDLILISIKDQIPNAFLKFWLACARANIELLLSLAMKMLPLFPMFLKKTSENRGRPSAYRPQPKYQSKLTKKLISKDNRTLSHRAVVDGSSKNIGVDSASVELQDDDVRVVGEAMVLCPVQTDICAACTTQLQFSVSMKFAEDGQSVAVGLLSQSIPIFNVESSDIPVIIDSDESSDEVEEIAMNPSIEVSLCAACQCVITAYGLGKEETRSWTRATF